MVFCCGTDLSNRKGVLFVRSGKPADSSPKCHALEKLFAARISCELNIFNPRASNTTPGVRGIVRVDEEAPVESVRIGNPFKNAG